MISNRVLFRLGINISRQLSELLKAHARPSDTLKEGDLFARQIEWACMGCKDREVREICEAIKTEIETNKKIALDKAIKTLKEKNEGNS